ncbi:putative helicase superfamily protein [Mycoplasmoides gallisepticum CA06_2006.052-5-2P]|uniref:Putative helicase superfamily protein n=1 Tax=Mycoplasmoides gallisepticum WI01_2001.043-13-2P TaxID=1159201 RepID=J3YGK7_MYCGL|nr:AAA domain-containing protein [Mycoplasmoides gallisepticum]AFP75733.1 putative helicase superfamily protein [Mycoplasmoides gallisepticum VA94_7994-1-7P]AFP76500.1 putative helicase superfamily protein [Mycoplasmoides gallisepticum NC95_13295-2-2P]AFP77254.1 putative helicase superfamily protein [Mycoplasmoides gallisepticum NC96_1596-4-2P]AFP78025.1 putative helicase superfamily protein [Mycoplasmoides gallisepticum NY01_2001.047-5-1P]AFP78785.1 putative helicase superfamily protein [Myco
MANDWTWLRTRLINNKTKSNTFWIRTRGSSVMDIGVLLKLTSNIYDLSIKGILSYLNSNDTLELDLRKLRELSDLEAFNLFGIETAKELYKEYTDQFSKIFKKLVKEERVTGDTSLFIGLPIIEGCNQWGDSYRAPLLYVEVVLYPVNQYQKIVFKINRSEFWINTTILAVEASKRGILFENKYDSSKLDFEQALEIFRTFDIGFKKPSTNELINFKEMTKKAFLENWEQNGGINNIVNNVVLGNFDIKGDKLLKDFTEILDKDPDTVDEVFNNKKDLLFNYEKFANEYSLSDIYLTSHLDFFQQLAVKHALEGDVVIEGPPGTGKSETILNILINIALKGKTALFVSEKTTATEVVYNRLGKFKHLALYIPSLNKEPGKFYRQFSDYENYFSENYYDQVHKTPNAKFDPDYLKRYLEQSYIIHKIYNYEINSGDNVYSFLNLILNYKPMDVDHINIDDYTRFDEWLKIYTNQDWMTKHQEYIALFNEIDTKWKASTFATFLKIHQKDPNDIKTLLYAIHLYAKKGIVKDEYRVPFFFRPHEKVIESAKLVTEQINKFIELEQYKSETKKRTILKNLEVDIKRYHKQYFNSWFVQNHSGAFLSKLNSAQSALDNLTDNYSSDVDVYIQSCKRNLKAEIIKNFYELYRHDKRGLLDVCRQGRNKSFKNIAWWFNLNREIIKKMFKIHIMSFETASILLENKKDLYDYVIVDEASQVFLERAIPALYRAKKYIIAGDTKQLQPSSFFSSRSDYDDVALDKLADEEILEVEESVNAVSLIHYLKERSRINVVLRYHYRSNFGDLIAFTNDHVYDNELIFMNKAIKQKESFVVHDIIDGKWKDRKNIPEAQAIVSRIQRLTKTADYQKSLGIVAFNRSQADLIELMLDKLNDPLVNEWRERNNDNGEYIGLFVKSVENVQGDERDIIIFSVAYDKSVVSYGPISSITNGVNRLNVAITRAKDRIELFKTNKASEYNGWGSSSAGTRLFVEYLSYCENVANHSDYTTYDRQTTEIEEKLKDKSLIFDDVKSTLEKAFGQYFTIKRNVDNGSYNFDFVIYHEEVPFLVIDLDIKPFKGMADFNESFIYRNIFLKNRGWKHFIIWSTEWKLNKRKVLLAIKDILDKRIQMNQK